MEKFHTVIERTVQNNINGNKRLKYFWPFARLQRISHCRFNAILNGLVLPLNGMAYVNILKRPLWLAHYVFSCNKLCNIFVHAQFLVLLTFISVHYAFLVVANFVFLQNAKLIWMMDVVVRIYINYHEITVMLNNNNTSYSKYNLS